MKKDVAAGDIAPEQAAGAKSFSNDLPEGAYSIWVWHAPIAMACSASAKQARWQMVGR
ncbi:hypothetical protein [Hyphomonas sp.]|uniref:hypothetical protein n=1 Tax=Hyphomonas sp. TaxID=87 RepID=UPI00333FBEC5